MNRAYIEAFLSAIRKAWRAPSGLLLSTVFYLLIMVMFSALWKVATEKVGGRIAGYDYRQLLWYMMATEAAVIAAPARRVEDIGKAIGDGSFEVELLRPISVLGLRVATELGEAAVQLVLAIVAGGVFTWAVIGPPVSTIGTLLAVPAFALAVVCNLVAVHAFASIAFWLRDAKTTWIIYQKIVFLVGAMLFPLQLLPHGLQIAAWTTPFWTMAYAPGRLMSGHVEPWLIIGQLGWLVALVGVTHLLFAAGERRLLAGR